MNDHLIKDSFYLCITNRGIWNSYNTQCQGTRDPTNHRRSDTCQSLSSLDPTKFPIFTAMRSQRFYLLLLLLCLTVCGISQTITIIHDDLAHDINDDIEVEVRQLLRNADNLTFIQKKVSDVINPSALQKVYEESDVVVASSYGSSILIGAQQTYSKPTIIGLVFNHKVQGIPLSTDGRSGVPNLTYVESPFDISRDFHTLREIIDYDRLAIVMDEQLVGREAAVKSVLSQFLPAGAQLDMVVANDNTAESISRLEGYDAVYFLPVHEVISNENLTAIYTGLADRGIVTFTMLSYPAIEQGAYATYSTDANLDRIPRRVALNIMKIIEGQKPEDLSVKMPTYTEDLVINMEAVNRSGVYPPYTVLQNAIIENISHQGTNTEVLTLPQAITEGLQNNLQLAIAKKDINISDKDIAIAKSNILPQLDLTGSAYTLDEGRTILQGQGTLGALNLNAQLDLTQVVLSEPALANITIQKLLKESNQHALETNELDIVQNIINAYLGILQTKALVQLNNENLTVSRQNYNIAKNRQQVGQGGPSDVYRWESQLALQNVEVNNALAQLTQARHGLAFLLNRDLSEISQVDDVDLESLGMLARDERLLQFIKNPNDLQILTDFMVMQALENLPEIKQIEASLKAQERNLLSQKRAFYLPQLAISGNLTQPLGHYNVPEGVTKINDVPRQYQLALGLQMPLFQGNKRKHQQSKTEVQILQLEDNKELLMDNLEMNVRNNMAIASAALNNMQLTRDAATAAAKNFDIAQNSYREGLLNITSLIDAQNALLQSNINATNAEYTFMRDIIALERSTGQYTFISSPADRDAMYQRFADFMSQKK